MASSSSHCYGFLYLSQSHSNFTTPIQITSKRNLSITKSSSQQDSDSDPNLPSPDPNFSTLNKPESFPIEKRRRSEILRQRRPTKDLVKTEPPNFEIGWKRTKEINLEKPIGWMIMDFLEKLEGLMEREFGSTELLAKVGEIVAERAREEAEILLEDGKVDDRMVTELFRVLKLMEMDLEMVKAAVKDETLTDRLAQAKARCSHHEGGLPSASFHKGGPPCVRRRSLREAIRRGRRFAREVEELSTFGRELATPHAAFARLHRTPPSQHASSRLREEIRRTPL